MLSPGSGSSRPDSSRTSASIWSTMRSASSSRPWMKSQRGLSGTWRRTIRMASPRIAPIAKAIRQPTSAANSEVSSRKIAPIAPIAAPTQ